MTLAPPTHWWWNYDTTAGFQDEALAFLQSTGVGFCNIDQPAHDHCIPPTEHVLSPVGYVRLHGRNHARWFDHDEASQRYDYLYTEQELDAWVGRIRRIAQPAAIFSADRWTKLFR